jgi:hypothetical protein
VAETHGVGSLPRQAGKPLNVMQFRESEMSSDEINTLLDERALKTLCLDYGFYADTRDGESFAKLFTSDAVLEGSGLRFDTPETLREVPNRLRIYRKTYHLIHNVYVEINGDEATGIIYSSSHHLKENTAGTLCDIVMYITYHDRYLRRDNGWKFERRKLILEFSEEKAVKDSSKVPKSLN